MRRLYIIVEGQTEEEFVKQTLRPFFNQQEIYDVRPIKMTTSRGHKGGFVNYEHLRNDAIRLLRQEDNILVSTFVDFYKIPSSLPGYQEMASIQLAANKTTFLQEKMAEDINDRRFIPYIQLHEFEALLFSSPTGFQLLYNGDERIMSDVYQILDYYTNPEDINDGVQTSPSKRLLNIITDYDKIVHSNLMAEEIGLRVIMNKCPRFKRWLEKLIYNLKATT